jgi:cullin 1
MYRLFHRITKGLEPVAEIFKQHVEAEGNKLVKEVSEDVESKKQEGERVHMRKLVCACVRVGVGVFVVWVGS